MKQYLLRIVLSPLVFLWGVFLVLAMSLFPLTILVLFSWFAMIACPIIWLLNASGATIKYPEPLTNATQYVFINHFIWATSHVWAPFYIAWEYIKTGRIFTGQ